MHGGEGAGAFDYRLTGYETDALTDLFIDQLRRYGQANYQGSIQPFFAVLWCSRPTTRTLPRKPGRKPTPLGRSNCAKMFPDIPCSRRGPM